MSEPTSIVRTIPPGGLAPSEAGEPPEPGQVWSRQLQRWVPRGQQFALDRAEQEGDPAFQIAQYDRRRTTLLQFVAGKLVEATYDEKRYPVKGGMRDFYILPNYDKKTITKGGASKVMDFLRHRVASRKVTHAEFTREHGSARVCVELVDADGRPVGAYEAACSTAEGSFQAIGARKKYGADGEWVAGDRGRKEWKETIPPDYRAAENDVVARAGKRAVVGAEIIAASLEEVFDLQSSAGAEDDGEEEDRGQSAPAATAKPASPAEMSVALDALVPFGKFKDKKTVTEAGLHYFEAVRDKANPNDYEKSWYRFTVAAIALLEADAARKEAEEVGEIAEAGEPPAIAVSPAEQMDEEINRLAADESIPEHTRTTYGKMWLALGDKITADDRNRILTNLRVAKTKAEKRAASK